MKAAAATFLLVACGAGPLAGAPAPAGEAALALATQLQEAFARVAERVFPSVVSITTFSLDPDWTREKLQTSRGPQWVQSHAEALLYPGFRPTRAGSGVVVAEDGFILSTHDNILDAAGGIARIIDVELPGDRHALARVAGAEPTINLALLAIEPSESAALAPAALGDSDAAHVGHWAIALGDPHGAERTYQTGTIAAQPQRRCYQEQLSRTLLQSSVRLHPESYGGPLVNIRGEVIGINVPRPAGVGLVESALGSEYALPINLVRGIYEALKEKGSSDSPWLGVSVLELDAAQRRFAAEGRTVVLPQSKYYPGTGLWIDNVFDPSPASRAGIAPGDFLVKIDGHLLFSPYDFQKWVYLAGVGQSLTVEIFRDGESREVRITAEARPKSATTR